MNQDQVLSIVRHVLTGVGSILVTKGLTDQAGLEAIIGGLVAVTGLLWSFFTHKSDPAAPTQVSK